MTTSILLLDCSVDLRKKLQARGYEVYWGLAGYATGVRVLPCQVYETELVIYNPTYLLGKLFGLKGEPQNKTTAIDFSRGAIGGHVVQGGHWLVFLNHLSDDPKIQSHGYSCVPGLPSISLTQDQKIAMGTGVDAGTPQSKLLPLFQSPKTLPIKRPVRVKMTGKMENFHPLLVNFRGEPLAGVTFAKKGSVALLPTHHNNEDVVFFYLDHVWPQLKPESIRGGLPEEFKSPDEQALIEETNKMQAGFTQLQTQYIEAQKKLSEARQAKLQILGSDATAKRIIGYYREAEADPRNAAMHLYKVRDALAKKFPDDATAKATLKCAQAWNYIGVTLNRSDNDARHAPKPDEVEKPLTPDEIKKCFESARELILGYFATLF